MKYLLFCIRNLKQTNKETTAVLTQKYTCEDK